MSEIIRWLSCTVSRVTLVLLLSGATTSLSAAEPESPTTALAPIAIGNRLELFVDDFLIEQQQGMEHRVCQPVADEVVLVCDQPWEGNTSAYFTILYDGSKYRAWYRGSHWDTEAKRATHPEVTCYAESEDGLHWVKPELGLCEFAGSTRNNIVWDGIGTHCFTPFVDRNPDCDPAARFKAVSRGRPLGSKGLYVFQSPDGIHWKLMHDQPVITEGAFDSQNLAFWDSHIGRYRE
ncbi:MAG: hypothetical protein KDA85_19610, partial [Planctomycetaceae bacterium]|nr:hypothetical protein [Planctomycetaceae bacterium]